MNFKTYAAVLLGCGFSIENEDGTYRILDESGEIVAVMGAGKEGNSYVLGVGIL
ncbi:MAG: hypothetical protein HFH92_03380 [Lachnospiraceae bacterium]|jgi:hypothetical protein|uniref:hypothetical protein n=1 Tax=uncultured Acetatifactor sp. TaxID=1671927 RepID=UPI0026022589|nr:hypothetical protein [uncultured Acetatifactor sp.]MCI8788146.1 hypothetical protein [Lachnospiraceae bacterium]